MILALAGVLLAAILVAWVPAQWGLALPQAALFALTLVWLIQKQARREALTLHLPHFLVAAAALWPWVQLAAGASIDRWETRREALGWLANLCAFSLASDLGGFPPSRRRLLDAVLWGGSAVAVLGTVQLFTSPGNVFWLFPSGYADQVIGPFVYKNQYAAFAELLIPVVLATALMRPNVRFACLLLAGFLVASVIASGSRAGAVLVVLEVAWLLLLAARRRTVLIVGAAALAFVSALGTELLWRRLAAPEPVALRAELNRVSLDMLRERPALGFGLGNWPNAYPRFARSDDGLYANRAHNDWLEWLVEGGLPFGLLIAGLAIWSIRPAMATLWGLGALPFWIHCLIDYPARKPALAMFLFLMLGLMASLSEVRRTGTRVAGSG
jgi:O-antigen ligase